MGIYVYEEGQFVIVYSNFNGVLVVYDLLVEGGMDSMLEDEIVVNDQLYIVGLVVLNVNLIDEVVLIFNKLKDVGIDKVVIYEVLYKLEVVDVFDLELIFLEEEKVVMLEKVYVNLVEGCKNFFDDVFILFVEINYFLCINKLDVLIEKLEIVIDKELDNILLYIIMGNVYDNLYQVVVGEGNEENFIKYFNKVLEYYNQVLIKDFGFIDVIYSIGVLYFNQVVQMIQELFILVDDFFKEGQCKYDVLQVEVGEVFEIVFFYFVEVEKKKLNDINILIVLKEIYVCKSDYIMFNEFKVCLEKVQVGEVVEFYFMKN